MSKRAIVPSGLPSGQYSQVVEAGGLVFTSGQVPYDEHGQLVSDDFAEQARQAFRNLGACLEAAGCGFQDVVKVLGFLEDFDDAGTYAEVYAEFFSPPLPARSTVRAGLAGFKVEVEAIAVLPVT